MTRSILPIVALIACQQKSVTTVLPSGGSNDTDNNDSADTDNNADTGDTGEPANAPTATSIDATISETITTVATVTWETETATEGYIEFGETTEYEFQTPLTDWGTSHSQALLGMPAETEIHYRIVSTDGSATSTSADQTVTTDPLPNAIPILSTTGTSENGFRVLTLNGSFHGPVIVDDEGQIVWYYQNTWDDFTTLQAKLTYDGQYLVFNSPRTGTQITSGGSLVWVKLDGSEEVQLTVEKLAHDFTQIGDGALCTIVNSEYEVGDSAVLADRLVEVNMQGVETEIWSAYDVLELPEFTEDTFDWTHANAIDYDAVENVYYVGMIGITAILKIDRSTGETLWTLGGENSDFTFAEDTEELELHHNFDITDNLLTIFINGLDTDDEGSRVVQYELDEETMIATEVWRYVSEASPWVYALGDTSFISDDILHVTFSTAGYVEQVENGVPTWTLTAPLGVAFGYSNFYESMYQ